MPAKLVEALDITTQLAMAAGFDALREAGIPLAQTYKKTSLGTFLPERCCRPAPCARRDRRDLASAFPGNDRLADEFERYYAWQNQQAQIDSLEDLRRYTRDPETLAEIGRRLGELRAELERAPYQFDRRFLFRILAMGHSQFAEYIGARGLEHPRQRRLRQHYPGGGPGRGLIRGGRCRRVVVLAADDVTSDRLLG